jgi:hypothetical protein
MEPSTGVSAQLCVTYFYKMASDNILACLYLTASNASVSDSQKIQIQLYKSIVTTGIYYGNVTKVYDVNMSLQCDAPFKNSLNRF